MDYKLLQDNGPTTTAPPRLKPGKIAKTVGSDVVATITNSLVVVAGFTWVQALQSLFDPHKGIFKKAAGYGPWIVAIIATILATFTTQIVTRVLKIKIDKKQ